MSSPTPTVKSGHIVRAGAGAGKTTRLVGKVLDEARAYRSEHGTWPNMIVTTFTIKATQELRARLMKKAIEIEDPEFLEFVSSPQQLQISTLHGVFYSFLRRYAHLLGLDANLDLYSGEEYYKSTTQVLREIVFTKPEFRSLLQRYGFHYLRKMCLQFYELVLVYPDMRVSSTDDFLTLQKKIYREHFEALKEAQSLILELVENEKWRKYANSLEAILALLNPAENKELKDGLDILEELKALGSKPRKNKDIDEEANTSLDQCLKQMKSSLSKPAFQSQLWPQYTDEFKTFEALALLFTQNTFDLKIENGTLDMSDIELMALKFISENPEVAEEFSHHWNFWLIDEYQDTSPLQVKILDKLIGESPYFVVGDPQQSIYLFRGARSEVFDEMQNKIEKEQGLSETLQKNYRSDPGLLCFFNDLFKSFGKQFQAMEPRDEVVNRSQTVAQFHFVKESCSGEKPVENGEYQMLMERLDRLVDSIERPGKKSDKKPVRWDQICILAKTHKELSRVARFLSTKGYPTFVHSSAGFYHRREIQDAMCLLRFLLATYDDANLMSLLRSPWFKVSDQVLVDAVAQADKSYWSTIQNLEDPAVQHLKSLLSVCESEGVSEALERGLLESMIFDTCQRDDETGRKESNLWKLVQWLREQERAPGFNPVQAYQQIQRGLQLGLKESTSDAVAALEPNSINFMTVHGSKGLEFEHVFLVGMHKSLKLSKSRPEHSLFNFHEEMGCWSFGVQLEGEVTKSSSVVDIDHLKKLEQRERDEFLRVLYVAVTRAEKTLDLFWDFPVAKNSWAELLNFDLTPGLHQRENYSYLVNVGEGIEEQSSSSVETELFYGLDSKKDYELSRIVEQQSSRNQEKEVAQTEVNSFIPQKYSVSAWLKHREGETAGSAVIPGKATHSKSLLDSLVLANEGVVLHKIFELLRYHHDFDWSSWLIDWVSEERLQEFDQAIQYVLDLDQPPLMELLEVGQAEWGFQMKIPQGLLEGQVDLWGVVNDEVWIVDYKTGRSRNVRKAVEQLQLYSLAIQEIFDFKKVNLCVLNPILKTVHIESSPEAQALRGKFGF